MRDTLVLANASFKYAEESYEIRQQAINFVQNMDTLLCTKDSFILASTFNEIKRTLLAFSYVPEVNQIQVHHYKIGIDTVEFMKFDIISKSSFEKLIYPKVSKWLAPSKHLFDYCIEKGKPLVFDHENKEGA